MLNNEIFKKALQEFRQLKMEGCALAFFERFLNLFKRLFTNRHAESGSDKSLRQWMGAKPAKDYPLKNFEEEEEARKDLIKVDDFTMTSYERMITLWNQVRFVDREGIPGSLVECGTWRGGACGMMALAHKRNGTPFRNIHLFDSFEGLPEPRSEIDGPIAVNYSFGRDKGKQKSIGRCVGTMNENQHVMQKVAEYPSDLTIFHKGWFHDTVPALSKEIGKIAILRLDGDWYDSTKVCLDHLFPLLSPGGFLIIDDYGKWEGCRKAVDEFLGKRPHILFPHYIDASGRYFQVNY